MAVNFHCGQGLQCREVILVCIDSYHEWVGQQTEDSKAADGHDSAHLEHLAVCLVQLHEDKDSSARTYAFILWVYHMYTSYHIVCCAHAYMHVHNKQCNCDVYIAYVHASMHALGLCTHASE